MIELLPDNEFTYRIWTPVEKAVSDNPDRRLLRGIASTEDADLHGEIVMQKGLDTSHLLNGGFINWNHRDTERPGAIIGVPVSADAVLKGLDFLGEIFPAQDKRPDADDAWGLVKTLEGHPEYNRKLGWSIQGRGRRNGRFVTRTDVRQMALTNDPAQAKSFAFSHVAKAMCEGLDSIDQCCILDYSSAVHLRKAMELENAKALLLENLDGAKHRTVHCDDDEEKEKSEKLAKAIFEVFGFGPDAVSKGVLDVKGRYQNGPNGLLIQLNNAGVDPFVAKDFVVQLYTGLGLNKQAA